MKKILGMGNALVDIMTILPADEVLIEFNLPKGSMQLVDEVYHQNIQLQTQKFERKMASGGSAANTIHGLARLGIATGFIGKVGTDEMGVFFRKDMMDNKINPFLIDCLTPSGVATALVSPDSERTFATFLGAACELEAKNIQAEIFENYHLFHIEGYLVQNQELIENAVKIAKDKGLMVSLDLASYNVVEDNLEFLKRIVTDYVDIVFANEDEAKAFTGKEPEEALVEMSKMSEIAVVKLGSKGSLIMKDGEISRVEGKKANCIDTTGAGDIYAAGFLYGYVSGKSMSECGRIGTALATRVVELVGPKLDEESWAKLLIEIQ
ncbi:MAG: adenosine kinase [Bacteroidales bacterium]|nr:adenosine kinase [Bacteroidales bacterium]